MTTQIEETPETVDQESTELKADPKSIEILHDGVADPARSSSRLSWES